MYQDVAKTGVGAGGFVASLQLRDINGILSAIVATLTIIYLVVSIVLKFRQLRLQKGITEDE